MSQNIDFGNLQITIEESAQDAIYTFKGDVDEHFRQKDVPRIKKDNIVFVLSGINAFNSCGIREWIYLIRDISGLGALKFVDCSVTMVDQINMVPDSLGSGVIESFYAPYFCQCGGEVNRLIEVGKFASEITAKQAPEFNCDRCGELLEFDALEESYFLFSETSMPNAS
jgi:hypothetical protein